MTITDTDSQDLQSATVRISSGFASGADILAFTAVNGITGSYNATTGSLTFVGSASVASYQTLLRSVTYRNTSDDPSDASRVIVFTVSDGNLEGMAERTLTVQPVDDLGNLVLPAEFADPTVPVQRDVGATIEFTADVSDPDNEVRLSARPGEQWNPGRCRAAHHQLEYRSVLRGHRPSPANSRSVSSPLVITASSTRRPLFWKSSSNVGQVCNLPIAGA